MDYELIRNAFAILGISWFSSRVIIMTADIIDKIKLWGWKKGIKKWWTAGADVYGY